MSDKVNAESPSSSSNANHSESLIIHLNEKMAVVKERTERGATEEFPDFPRHYKTSESLTVVAADNWSAYQKLLATTVREASLLALYASEHPDAWMPLHRESRDPEKDEEGGCDFSGRTKRLFCYYDSCARRHIIWSFETSVIISFGRDDPLPLDSKIQMLMDLLDYHLYLRALTRVMKNEPLLLTQ